MFSSFGKLSSLTKREIKFPFQFHTEKKMGKSAQSDNAKAPVKPKLGPSQAKAKELKEQNKQLKQRIEQLERVLLEQHLREFESAIRSAIVPKKNKPAAKAPTAPPPPPKEKKAKVVKPE